MSDNRQIAINVSIGDFSPLLRRPEYVFKGLRATGVTGIELWIGAKSRWTPAYYERLSQKYELPIVSLHQPLWAMTGMYFDAGFFTVAQKFGVQSITCHPLPGQSVHSARMHAYFKRLATIQAQIDIPILVENMPTVYRNGLLRHFFPLDIQATNVMELHKAASQFGLGITLDTDHAQVPDLHRQDWLSEVLPEIRNVHLSSFSDNRRHLPLYRGDLQVAAFIKYLQNKNYRHQITLEIGSEHQIPLINFNFDDIKKSVEIIRQV